MTDLEKMDEKKEDILCDLYDFIINYYGAECNESDPDCIVCNVWSIYEQLEDVL